MRVAGDYLRLLMHIQTVYGDGWYGADGPPSGLCLWRNLTLLRRLPQIAAHEVAFVLPASQ